MVKIYIVKKLSKRVFVRNYLVVVCTSKLDPGLDLLVKIPDPDPKRFGYCCLLFTSMSSYVVHMEMFSIKLLLYKSTY
jgi:hypothetical protein